MSEWQRKIYGNEAVDKQEAFLKRLDEIQEKYKYWFEKRPGTSEREKHDKLNNHYIISYNHERCQFGFENTSEVPKMIQDECYEAFNDIYKK